MFKLEIGFVVAWYDWWVGAYYDRKQHWLYIMIPFIGIRIRKWRNNGTKK